MVGEILGKEMCLCICVSGSNSRSWTWSPLYHYIRVGKSICLSSGLLQNHILGHPWVTTAKTIVMSFICSREVQPKLSLLLSLPYTIINFLPCRPSLCQFQIIFILWSTLTLLLILCHWWGIHQGPPVTSLFLSTSTHHPGTRLRNHLVP